MAVVGDDAPRITRGVRKAVVFGGGGSVGTGWQTGLNAGWKQAGIDLTDAGLILGTSAGAAVGVQVALGQDLDRQLDRYRAAGARHAAGQATRVLHFGEDQWHELRKMFAIGQAHGLADRRVRQEIARAALEAKTASEQEFLLTVKYLAHERWPSNYVCTALNVDTCEFVPLTAALGGDLQHGVAAAVAVPGFYPPITVAGQRYVDGGCLSPSHLDLAADFDRVLFVQMTETLQRELEAIGSSGAQLLVVKPDEDSLSVLGENLMDSAAAFDAAEAGLAQGLRTASSVGNFWSA
jgi:NTE family protein